MNWEALGANGETVGAIGAVATLIYLPRFVKILDHSKARSPKQLVDCII